MTSAVHSIALPETWRRKHLSPAEQRVVELAATGLSTKVIAGRLNKSTLTARNQLNRAMRKLGVRSRYELIAHLRPIAAPTENVLAVSQTTLEPEPDSFAYAI